MVVNFSGVDRGTWLGRAMRWPLALIPTRARMPIMQGRLRGLRWIAGASNHGCWLGSYERDQQRVFEQWVKPGDTVFDVGAHAGFYSLLASVLVGPGGRVVAFEPVARNRHYLEQHLRINALSNVEVIAAAVTERAGRLRLASGPSSSMWHADARGELEVDAVCLDDLVSSEMFPPPDLVKLDVEGAELLALEGSAAVIAAHRPIFVLSTHGREVEAHCGALLGSAGYRLTPIGRASRDAGGELLAVHESATRAR